jgi:hypothetical protein
LPLRPQVRAASQARKQDENGAVNAAHVAPVEQPVAAPAAEERIAAGVAAHADVAATPGGSADWGDVPKAREWTESAPLSAGARQLGKLRLGACC